MKINLNFRSAKIASIASSLVLLVAFFIYFLPVSFAEDVFNGSSLNLMFTSSEGEKIKESHVSKGLFGLNSEVEEIGDRNFERNKKKLFLSPDRTKIPVTMESHGHNSNITTFIMNVDGDVITKTFKGSFSSWHPDSNKLLLYLSDSSNNEGRRIFSLTTDGEYFYTGLPTGTIGADISIHGDMAYVVTEPGTDKSDLYIRYPDGVESLPTKVKVV